MDMILNQVGVREPLKSDILQLHHFFEVVLIDTFINNHIFELKETLREEVLDKKKCLNQHFETCGAQRFFLIATFEDTIIGTIEYGRSNDLIHQCTQGALDHVNEIGTVFVHPAHQKKGIGTLLVKEILNILKMSAIHEICLDSGYKKAQVYWQKKLGPPKYLLEDFWGKDANHMIWYLTVDECIERMHKRHTLYMKAISEI
jgi:GNAT superfamily N-acetyltransferase